MNWPFPIPSNKKLPSDFVDASYLVGLSQENKLDSDSYIRLMNLLCRLPKEIINYQPKELSWIKKLVVMLEVKNLESVSFYGEVEVHFNPNKQLGYSVSDYLERPSIKTGYEIVNLEEIESTDNLYIGSYRRFHNYRNYKELNYFKGVAAPTFAQFIEALWNTYENRKN